MKTLLSITLLFLFSGYSQLNAQVIESESSSYRLNNKPATKVEEAVDSNLPEISLIEPKVNLDQVVKVDNPEFTLIAQAKDESGISNVIVNSKFVEITEKGVFIEELILEEGENEIKLIAFDNNNNASRASLRVYSTSSHLRGEG